MPCFAMCTTSCSLEDFWHISRLSLNSCQVYGSDVYDMVWTESTKIIKKILSNGMNFWHRHYSFIIIFYQYIPHRFADWLARRCLATYYSPASSKRKTKWLPVLNKVTLTQVKLLFGPLVIQLVWYILKQLLTSVSRKVVDIQLTLRGSVNIHHYSPPLW